MYPFFDHELLHLQRSINYKNDFYVQGIVQMYIRKKGTSKIMQG